MPIFYKIDNIEGAFPIVLEQTTTKGKLFTVSYGYQQSRDLTYEDACKEIGGCLLHALCCAGLASNEGK